MKERLTLDDWIDTLGYEEVARILNLKSPKTVYYWRTRRSSPNIPTMRRIKKMSRGAIGYTQMIDRN